MEQLQIKDGFQENGMVIAKTKNSITYLLQHGCEMYDVLIKTYNFQKGTLQDYPKITITIELEKYE